MARHEWEAEITRLGAKVALECEGEFSDGDAAFEDVIAFADGERIELTAREEAIVVAHGWWTFGHDDGMREARRLASLCPECSRPGDAAFSRCCSRNCEAQHFARFGAVQVAA